MEGLLILARTDGAPIEAEAVDVDAALRDRSVVWLPVAADRDVWLRLEAAPTPAVLALPGSVEQVLDNLIANAVEVAPAGSTIVLRSQRAGDSVEIHVIDEGPGMAPEQREHAFDRFWRATASGHDGFGLGLAIVERLVTASGGRVELRTAPTGGLDAVVLLPAAQPVRVDV